MMRNLFKRLGRVKTCLVITAVSIICSILLYLILSTFFGQILIRGIFISIIIPTIAVPIIYYSLIRIVFELELTEKALRDSERKYKQLYNESKRAEEVYRSLIHSSADAIVIYDLEERSTYVSPSFTQIFGWTMEDVEGKSIPFIPETERETSMNIIKDVIENGTSYHGFESKRYTKNDRLLDISISASRYEDHEGKPAGMLVILRDITEKKRLEAQLQKADKMRSLGLMAGGIAHDLNNILSGLVTYPEFLLMNLSEDSSLRKPLETIKESGERAAAVVSDLITVARGAATGKEVLNLNATVEEYFNSAEYKELESRCPSITYKTHLDSELLNACCSSTHIKKSLMNLVVNASEAIEGSGTVSVSTMNRYLDEPLKGYEDIRQGEYVQLSVSDSGHGISSQDLERVFEPFYTNKVMGRSGTGLGLSVVWNTVQDHEGYINVKSSEEGTIFELYFSVTREEVADEDKQIPFEDYVGHGERILVVDDEENQREIACKLLNGLGYASKAVCSGEKAVEYLKEHSTDLVLLDMIMPRGMNGRETYEQIIKIHPNQKAIIASGFAKTEDVKITQKLGAGEYIKKPYTMEKIGLAIKEELNK